MTTTTTTPTTPAAAETIDFTTGDANVDRLLAAAVAALRAGVELGWHACSLSIGDDGGGAIRIGVTPALVVDRPGPVIQPSAPTEPTQGTDAWTGDDGPPGVVGPGSGRLKPPVADEPDQLYDATAELVQKGVKIGWHARAEGRLVERVYLSPIVDAMYPRTEMPEQPTEPEQGVDVAVEPAG